MTTDSGAEERALPQFAFFKVDAPEAAFGCPIDRYLPISKAEASAICDRLPEECQMANLLFLQGHLGEEGFGMEGRSYAIDATPEEVRATTGALLRSFGPSHEVKIATLSVALHNWFPRALLTPIVRAGA